MNHTRKQAEIQDFIEAEIHGGPHDGQRFRCPTDQDTVTFHDGGEPHTYHRLSSKPVFHSEDRIAKLFPKRGRR